MIGILVGHNKAEGDRVVCRPLQLAAGEHARGVAVNQKPNQQAGMVAGRARAAIGFAHRREVQLIDDIHYKPRQMIFRQPIINGRRQQIGSLTVDRAEIAHEGAAKLENQSPEIPLFKWQG